MTHYIIVLCSSIVQIIYLFLNTGTLFNSKSAVHTKNKMAKLSLAHFPDIKTDI